MENKLQKDIEFAGKNYKKERLKIILLNVGCLLISAAIYFLLNNNIYVLIPLIFAGIIDFFYISSFSNNKKRIEKDREKEFIQIISYFQIFINNHINVYQCFKQLIPYCSAWMAEQIETMLNEIDADKTIQPFINFASKFKTPLVRNVMLSIYQMVDSGESSEQLNQFEIFFSQLEKAQQKDKIDAMERSLSSIDTYPLAGAGCITILITISVLLMMGDLINVI